MDEIDRAQEYALLYQAVDLVWVMIRPAKTAS